MRIKPSLFLSKDDQLLFRESVLNVKKLPQDTIGYWKPRGAFRQPSIVRKIKRVEVNYYFSDEYQPLLKEVGPLNYIRPGENSYKLKKLKRGDYSPDWFLDLHGLTQMQAKLELGALIEACKRERLACACIIHGHGKDILKKQTPRWLAQHSDVLAFLQAPKELGGNAAILLLVDLGK